MHRHMVAVHIFSKTIEMNKESRTKNSIRNILFGLLSTAINVAVSFVVRTALVKSLGIENLSLNGLFNEIISMLSLVEMGTGMAIIYSLYKPISENDEKKISQLMGLYRKAYHTIAIAIFIIGTAIMPFVHLLINEVDFSVSYIRIVFMLFVTMTASTYLFSFKISLLNADQKQYLVSLITALVHLIFVLIFVAALLVFKNFIIYLVLLIVESVVTNLILSVYVDRKYPFVDYREKLEESERKEVFTNIKNIFWKRVSGVITNSTDNILISVLVGTIQVGFYSNYALIYRVFRTLISKVTGGVAASIGNLSVTSDSKHNIEVLKRLTFIYYLFGMIAASGLMCVSESFVTIWLGEKYVMIDPAVYISVFILFLDISAKPLWQFLEVSGLFRMDKYIGLLGNIVNMVISVILGMRIGIIGIFIGTICAKFIEIVLKTFILYRNKFETNALSFYVFWLRILISYCALTIVSYFAIRPWKVSEHLIVEFLVKGSISVCLALVTAVPLFIGGDEMKYCFKLLKHRG